MEKSAATWTPWAQEWLQTSGREHAGRRVRARRDGARTRPSPCGSPPTRLPTLRRHWLRHGLLRRRGQPLGPAYVAGDRRQRRSWTEVAELVGSSSPTCCCSTRATSPTPKIRLDELARHRRRRPGDPRTTRWRGRCAGGAAWDMTRDAEMSDRLRRAMPSSPAARDRRVRRVPDPRVRRRAQASTLYTAPPPTRSARHPGSRAAHVARRRRGRRDHQLSFARPTPAPRTTTARLPTSRACSTARSLRPWRWTPRLRWTLLKALARTAAPTRTGYGSSRARQHDLRRSRQRVVRAMRPTAEAKAEAWEIAMVRDDILNETQRSVVQPSSSTDRDEVLAPLRQKYLMAADTMWGDKGAARLDCAGVHLPQAARGEELLDRVPMRGWSRPRRTRPLRYVREGRRPRSPARWRRRSAGRARLSTKSGTVRGVRRELGDSRRPGLFWLDAWLLGSGGPRGKADRLESQRSHQPRELSLSGEAHDTPRRRGVSCGLPGQIQASPGRPEPATTPADRPRPRRRVANPCRPAARGHPPRPATHLQQRSPARQGRVDVERLPGPTACSASIWIPRRRPPTRSPAANRGLHLGDDSSTSRSLRVRRTSPR